MYTLVFLINSLKIGLIANKKFVYFPANKFALKILKFLFFEGFVLKVLYLKKQNLFKVYFKYSNFGYSNLQYLKILSKISLQMYITYFELSKLTKIGVFLLSTPYGLMSNSDCLKLKIGGKMLAYLK